MSREIKFRCWDNLANRHDKNHHISIDLDGNVINLQNGAGSPELVPEQSTGQKDKNGVEGWDHDIIMAPIGTGCGIVQWDDFYGAWWVYVDGKAFAPLADAIRIGGHFAGNVHQNPELLQK